MSLTDDELRALASARPEDFVRVRNELARTLRKAGRRDDADAIAARRRPSPIAWSLNQVALEHPGLLDDWFEAAARLRDAMHGALRGDADDVRAAQSAERRATDAVVTAARGQLDELGHRNTDAAVARIAGTMRAAALEPEVAHHLRDGTLESEVVASGFGLAEMAIEETRAGTAAPRENEAPARASGTRKQPDAATTGNAAAKKAAAKKQAADERTHERARAADRAALQAEVARLTTVATRLATAADKAQRKVDDLRAQADQLSERLRLAERESRAARGESDRAAAAAERARARRDG